MIASIALIHFYRIYNEISRFKMNILYVFQVWKLPYLPFWNNIMIIPPFHFYWKKKSRMPCFTIFFLFFYICFNWFTIFKIQKKFLDSRNIGIKPFLVSCPRPRFSQAASDQNSSGIVSLVWSPHWSHGDDEILLQQLFTAFFVESLYDFNSTDISSKID